MDWFKKKETIPPNRIKDALGKKTVAPENLSVHAKSVWQNGNAEVRELITHCANIAVEGNPIKESCINRINQLISNTARLPNAQSITLTEQDFLRATSSFYTKR